MGFSKNSYIAVFGAAVLAVLASACQPNLDIVESLRPRPAMTLYVVGDGQAATVRLTVRRANDARGNRVLIRAFNEDEDLTYWRYIEPGKMQIALRDGKESVSVPSVGQPFGDDLVWEGDIPLGEAGVQQIRVVGGAHNSVVAVALSREQGWGVSFQNGAFSSWSNQPSTLYAYVPPHAEYLELAGGPVRIYDENDQFLGATESTNRKEAIRIDVGNTGVVWRFEFPRPENWRFSAAGFPLILSPTAEAVREIRASVEVLPDGTVVNHKFQRKIADLLRAVLSPENVGDSDELIGLIEPLTKYREQWLSEPARNAFLMTSVGAMPSVIVALRTQNLDPLSHWGGSINGWQDRIGKLPPENRWDRLRSLDGLWAGASTRSTAAQNLAQMSLIDAPFNPLYGRTELLYRAAASALLDLMTLGEDEIFRGINADMDPYPGFMAFPLGQKVLPVFRLVAPYMPENIRRVWTEAVRRVVDRTLPENLVNARNQSAHYLVAFQAFADGSNDPVYRKLARHWAQRFVDGMHPAGFHYERKGPDASYIGITHWFEAVYYRMSGDPNILESLRRSYRFFNHTVAPEPDGKMIGGFNFNHRMGRGFVDEQWGGARGILSGLLPEIDLWDNQLRGERAKISARNLNRWLTNPRKPLQENLDNPRYLYFARPSRESVWPAQSKQSFIRQFGNELIAVKRPNYFVSIYVGRPAPYRFVESGPKRFELPLPDNAENTGGKAHIRRIAPFLGGGVSLFWTPEYGTALVGTSLSPLARHGLLAVRKDGTRSWESYSATEFKLDRDEGVLKIKGRIYDQPIRYERLYRFGDDALEVEIKLIAELNVNLANIIENMPIAMGPIKERGVRLRVEGETENGTGLVDSFVVSDRQGAGVLVQFDKPRAVRVQRNGLRGRTLQVGRVEINLPSQLRAGQAIRFQYRIVPQSF